MVIYELGEKTTRNRVFFPSLKNTAESTFDFIKIPSKHKETLSNLADYLLTADHQNAPNHWLSLKGIGPWTIDYAKMRGLSDPDIYLAGDLGVKKAMEKQVFRLNLKILLPSEVI